MYPSIFDTSASSFTIAAIQIGRQNSGMRFAQRHYRSMPMRSGLLLCRPELGKRRDRLITRERFIKPPHSRKPSFHRRVADWSTFGAHPGSGILVPFLGDSEVPARPAEKAERLPA